MVFNFNKEIKNTAIEYVEVINIIDVPPGQRIFVEIDGQPIIIINNNGKINAISDTCTHDYGPLGDGDVVDNQIVCPRHGARFDLSTGKVMGLPAVSDIDVFHIKIVDGMILVGIQKQE